MKRERGADLARLERMLEADKEDMNDACRRAAARDLERVAEEYFEREGAASLTTERDGKGLKVTFSFRAVRVKNFTSLK
ncbi:MAG: hypothetical protein ACI4NG_02465 [Candidatus Gallimonas sp.]